MSAWAATKLFFLRAGVLFMALFWAALNIFRVLYGWARVGNKYWKVRERTVPPSCLQDPAYGKHATIKLKNLESIKLHYVANGDPAKPLMLLLHGFPEFWFSWRHQLKYFAKSHWVVAVDMRGCGDSQKPPCVSDYSFEILQEDVVELVKALGKDSCILVGHDWGGVIAWAVAANHPEIVSKLVIMNAPHPTVFQKVMLTSVVQFVKAWYVFILQLPHISESGIFVNDLNFSAYPRLYACGSLTDTEEELEAYKYTFGTKASWTPPINYYRSMVRRGLRHMAYGTEPPLPKIKMPTLIIWGENDVALLKSVAERARPFVEDLRIEYIKDGTHFIQTDKPDVVNRLLESFV